MGPRLLNGGAFSDGRKERLEAERWLRWHCLAGSLFVTVLSRVGVFLGI